MFSFDGWRLLLYLWRPVRRPRYRYCNFPAVNFLKFFGHQNPGFGSGSGSAVTQNAGSGTNANPKHCFIVFCLCKYVGCIRIRLELLPENKILNSGSAVFTWTNLLVVVAELDGGELDLDQDPDPHWPKMLDTEPMRIRNTALLFSACVGWIRIRLELLPEIKFWILAALCSPGRTCWWWWRSWMAESRIWIRIRIDQKSRIRNQCGSETLLYCWDFFCLCKYVGWIRIRLEPLPELNFEYVALCSPGRVCWWWWRRVGFGSGSGSALT